MNIASEVYYSMAQVMLALQLKTCCSENINESISEEKKQK
jgi:hypothetical protein